METSTPCSRKECGRKSALYGSMEAVATRKQVQPRSCGISLGFPYRQRRANSCEPERYSFREHRPDVLCEMTNTTCDAHAELMGSHMTFRVTFVDNVPTFHHCVISAMHGSTLVVAIFPQASTVRLGTDHPCADNYREISGRSMKHSNALQNSGSKKTILCVMKRLFL